MTEPAQEAPDTLERDLDAAIALCDGDVRAALRAALVYNHFLERELRSLGRWSRAVTHAARFRRLVPRVRNWTTGASCSATPNRKKGLDRRATTVPPQAFQVRIGLDFAPTLACAGSNMNARDLDVTPICRKCSAPEPQSNRRYPHSTFGIRYWPQPFRPAPECHRSGLRAHSQNRSRRSFEAEWCQNHFALGE